MQIYLFLSITNLKQLKFKADLNEIITWHKIVDFSPINEMIGTIQPQSQNIATYSTYLRKDKEAKEVLASSVRGLVDSSQLNDTHKYSQLVLLDSGKYKMTRPVSPEGFETEDAMIFEEVSKDDIPDIIKE